MVSKCPHCGSEYHSSAPTCFACSRLERAGEGRGRLSARRLLVFAVGAILFTLGVVDVLSTTRLVPEEAWRGMASFGVLLAAIGTALMSYSITYRDISLREFRQGTEPRNRLADAFLAVGCGVMTYATGYVAASSYIGFPSRPLELLGMLLPISAILVVMGGLRLPRVLFRTSEAEMAPAKRAFVGRALLAAGFGVQTVTFLYGYWQSLTVLAIGWVWFMMIGPLIVIIALTILWPMGRPWIPGGYSEDAGDGKS
jgi:hypothetical protein